MIKSNREPLLTYYQQLLDQTKLFYQKMVTDDDSQCDFFCDNRQRLINILIQKSQLLKREQKDSWKLMEEEKKIINDIVELDQKITDLLNQSKEKVTQELTHLYKNKKKLQGYNLQKVNRR